MACGEVDNVGRSASQGAAASGNAVGIAKSQTAFWYCINDVGASIYTMGRGASIGGYARISEVRANIELKGSAASDFLPVSEIERVITNRLRLAGEMVGAELIKDADRVGLIEGIVVADCAGDRIVVYISRVDEVKKAIRTRESD